MLLSRNASRGLRTPVLPVALRLAAAFALLVASSAFADVVHLKDGSKLVGTIQVAHGAATILTLDGEREFDPIAALSIEDSSSLARRIESLERECMDDAARWNAVARFAVEKGMFDAAFDAADRALKLAQGKPAVDASDLPQEVLDLPLAGTHRGDVLTPQSATAWLAAASDPRSPSRAIVARGRLRAKIAETGVELSKPILAALANGLADKSPRMRTSALDAIAIALPGDLATSVGEHLVRDRDSGVRKAALDVAIAFRNNGDQRILPPVLKALEAGGKARSAALDALEALLDTHAVAALVRTLAASGASGIENSMSVTNQVSYVSDFDVEVATASAIADPIVSVLQDGVTLDVTIYGISERGLTSEERARIEALLERLTARHYGSNAKAWKDWLAGQKKAP